MSSVCRALFLSLIVINYYQICSLSYIFIDSVRSSLTFQNSVALVAYATVRFFLAKCEIFTKLAFAREERVAHNGNYVYKVQNPCKPQY